MSADEAMNPNWTERTKDYDSYANAVANRSHGIRSAYYSNLPGPNQTAWIECVCGEEITGQTSSWEDTGRELDLHLKGVSEAQQAS